MTSSAQGDSVVILFRGGRLPEWHRLDETQRRDYERQHVDLMLSVSERHGLIGLHGYRLLAPRNSWERFWTIEFPDLAGAEAWMSAEVEPPYGRYGFYDYSLARRWQPESLAWLPRKPEPPVTPDADPHVIPPLTVDPASIIVLAFGGWRRGSDQVDPRTRGDEERQQRLHEVAREHDLIHGEIFRLLGTNTEGEFLWILEFPNWPVPKPGSKPKRHRPPDPTRSATTTSPDAGHPSTSPPGRRGRATEESDDATPTPLHRHARPASAPRRLQLSRPDRGRDPGLRLRPGIGATHD